MSIIKKITHNFEEFVCCVAVVIIAVCVFVQVVARYVFNHALHWTEELASMSMVWAVYMGVSLCIRERYHVRILVVVTSLPPKLGRFIIVIADIVWLLFSILMIKLSINYLNTLWQYPEISQSLSINQFYPQSILFIGYGLMTLRILECYYLWYRHGFVGLPGIDNDSEEDEAVL